VTNGWTYGQYRAFRVVFGAYLCAHFLSLAPWGAELFSGRGMLPDATASPLAFFPNVLAFFDPPFFVTLLLLLAGGAGALLAAGGGTVRRQPSCGTSGPAWSGGTRSS
jgi:hypothetical protein